MKKFFSVLAFIGFITLLVGAGCADSEDLRIPVAIMVSGVSLLAISAASLKRISDDNRD